MREQFPNDAAYIQDEKALLVLGEQVAKAEREVQEAKHIFEAADGRAKAQARKSQKAAEQKYKDLTTRLTQARTNRVKPPWIQACRLAFPSDKMRRHVNDDDQDWDTYKLLKIIQYFLPNTFASVLGGDQRHAYELLRGLVQVLKIRNTLAHRDTDDREQHMTEHEIIDAIRLFDELLNMCNKPSPSIKKIQV